MQEMRQESGHKTNMTQETLTFDDDRSSQRERIKHYLLNGGKVTSLSALTLFQCLRLSERVREIEAQGLAIEHTPIRVGRKRVMEYSVKNFLMCKGNGHHNWSLNKDSCECGELKSDDTPINFTTLSVPEGRTLEIGEKIKLEYSARSV